MTVPRTAYPAVVAAATLGATVVIARTGDVWGAGSFLLGMLPVAISTAWGISYLVAGSLRRHSLAAVGTIVMAATISPTVTVAITAYVASGLTLGWALGRRLRFDAVLAAGLLPMVLVVANTLVPVSSEDLLTEYGRNLTEALRQSLPPGGDEVTRQTLIAEYERVIAGTTKLLVRIWPAVLFAGLVGEIGLVMVLVRWLAILAAKHISLRPWPPFPQWEVPFYWVWVLAVGLVLIVLRRGSSPQIGINLVLVAALMFSVHGLAVQVNLLGRLCPPWLRIVFWTVTAFCFAPFLLIGSAVLGLCDQWLNLRKRSPLADSGPV